MSLVMDERTWVRFSRSMPAWREPTSSWDHMTSLVIRTPHGAFAAMRPAVSSAALCNSSSATTRSTSPIAIGLFGVNDAPRQHQLPGPRGADQPGQQPAHADVAPGETEPHEGDVEACGCRGDADVAGQGQGEAAARRRAVHGGDHGLRQGRADAGTSAAMSVWVAKVVSDSVEALRRRVRRRSRRGPARRRSPARRP